VVKVYYGSWHHCITFRLRVECICLQCFWQVGKHIFGALLGCYCKWCPVLSLHTVEGGGGGGSLLFLFFPGLWLKKLILFCTIWCTRVI